jgi:hypothetical protein
VTEDAEPQRAASAAAAARVARDVQAMRVALDGANRVRKYAAQWRNASAAQRAGRMAEELHATTFNLDAVAKYRDTLRASTTAANGAGRRRWI